MGIIRSSFVVWMLWLGIGSFVPRVALGAGDVPVIAAASDLQFAVSAIVEAFRRDTGRDVRVSFGSSGNFARQIRLKAPFEVFFSADENYVLELANEGIARDRGAIYAIGRLAIVVPKTSAIKADSALTDLGAALADGRLKRFAIANPEHAPYGKRAQEALERTGLWLGIKDKLVLGENVSQAGQFAVSGSTDGGIIAYSLALSPKISDVANVALLPEALHEPLRQRMVLLKDAGPVALQFYEYVRGEAARDILTSFGFIRPGAMP